MVGYRTKFGEDSFFDLETETYDKVLHRMYDEGNKTLDLGVLGGWLCVVCNYDTNHVADVWVMKDYGEKDSWTKLVSIPYPIRNPLMAADFTRVVGSCKGLLCISHYRGLSIYNPSPRRCNMLYGGFSDEHPYQVGYGFGYVMSTDDYKVVGISNADNKVKMYSLNTRNWKNLSDFPHGCKVGDDAVFLNGCVQWLDIVPNLWKLVSFNLETKTYDEVLHPKYDEDKKTLDLRVLGGWLCVVYNYDTNHVADVWVMKDYGEKDSWTKLVSIPYPVSRIHPSRIPYPEISDI
ncbi:F-box associated domain containing protein [Tanacetum coccineum]|uniref:F-box associated domain containing protein n=1 Tax=Tanacetum coccineum TaxID=301880 RepID=A0ABQ4ZQW0_9ASTR